MPYSLDVTGDDIWYGGRLVGRILIPTSSERDVVEELIKQDAVDHEEEIAALVKEYDARIDGLEEDHQSALDSLEDQLAAAENEADALRETLDAVDHEEEIAATVLKDLTDALRVALADNDRLRQGNPETQEPEEKQCALT